MKTIMSSAFVLLAGCAHGFNHYPTESLMGLPDGTHKDKYVADYGQPQAKFNLESGGERWIYVDKNGNCNIIFINDVSADVNCGNKLRSHSERAADIRATMPMPEPMPEEKTKIIYVEPYYRDDGTYVQGHQRTTPDGIVENNLSYQNRPKGIDHTILNQKNRYQSDPAKSFEKGQRLRRIIDQKNAADKQAETPE